MYRFFQDDELIAFDNAMDSSQLKAAVLRDDSDESMDEDDDSSVTTAAATPRQQESWRGMYTRHRGFISAASTPDVSPNPSPVKMMVSTRASTRSKGSMSMACADIIGSSSSSSGGSSSSSGRRR